MTGHVERKNRRIAKLVANVTVDGQVQSTGFDIATVSASIPGITLDNYDSIGQLPTSSLVDGGLAFIGNTLYLSDQAGWFRMLSVNNTPVFNSITDDSNNVSPFSLSVDGSQTVITIDATDSEGFPLTYSVTADSAFNGMATYTQSSNVFTITPFSEDSATAASGTLTFNISDGINTANSAAQSFSLDFLSEYWDNTVISLAANENNGRTNSGVYINDGTGPNGNTGIWYENALLESSFFNPYSSSYSTYFDGTNDYYAITDSTDFEFGSGDFTVEMWVNFSSWESTGFNTFLFKQTQSNAHDWQFDYKDQTNELRFIPYVSNSATFTAQSATMYLNRWHHVAATRSGNTIYLFLDGVLKGSFAFSGTIDATAGDLWVGCRNEGTADRFFNGYMSDLRIVKGTALYTSNFTLPTSRLTAVANTSLLAFADNRVQDTSGNNHTFTRYSEPAVDSRSPYGSDEIRATGYIAEQGYGSVFARNQTTKYGMSMGNASTAYHSFGSSFYVDFWLYTYPTNACNVVGYYTGTGLGTLIGYDGSQAFLSDGRVRATIPRADFFNYAPPRQWSHHHVQYSWDGYDFRFSWYINGVRRSNVTGNFAPNNSVNITRWTLGSHNTSADYNMQGNIADFTAANGNPYNHGTTGPTVPTAPKGDTTATFYMPFDNVGVYNKNNHYRFMSLAGNVSSSTAQTKYALASVYFDGNGDYISSSATDITTMDKFTIEAWIYLNASGFQAIIANHNNGTNAGYFFRVNSNGSISLVFPLSTGNQHVTTGTGISTGQWHHISACKDGSTVYASIDGTVTSNTVTAGNASTNATLIGCSASGVEQFNGYMENMQLIHGVAKYTSNFTPPIKEQGRTYQAIS